MKRPNEDQVQAAAAAVKHHVLQYGSAGTEDHRRKLVYSVFAIMGGPGKPTDEYMLAVEDYLDSLPFYSEEARRSIQHDVTNDISDGILTIDPIEADATGMEPGEYALVPVNDPRLQPAEPEEQQPDPVEEPKAINAAEFEERTKEELVIMFSNVLNKSMSRDEMWVALIDADLAEHEPDDEDDEEE